MTPDEFINKRPVMFALLIIVGLFSLLGIGRMVWQRLMYNKKVDFFKNADFLRQTMAPALNETTGFLLVSYAVILCIGNVIMKTSPKYLTEISEESVKTTKVKGVVSFLQQSNMSWVPFMVASIGIAISSFIPFEDKKLKIIVIGIVLIVSIIIALIFNEVSNFFRKKDSFTDVKEEFGHMVKGKKHPFEIAVGTQKWKKIDNVVYFRYDNADETHKTESSLYQAPRTANHGVADNNIELDNEIFNNQLTIKLNEGKAQGADIYYSEFPWGSPGGETTLKKINEPLTITVESESKTIYFHSFEKDTLVYTTKATVRVASTDNVAIKDDDSISIATDKIDGVTLTQNNLILLTGQTDTKQNGVYKVGTVTAATTNPAAPAKTIISKDATQPSVVKVTEGNSKDKYFSISVDSTTKDVTTKDVTDNVVLWEKHVNKKLTTNSVKVKSIVLWEGDKNKLTDYITDSPDHSLGVVINLKNMEKFFGFDVQAVKQSVTDSYIAYYCLVWGSFFVYSVVTGLQKRTNMKSFLQNIGPFMGAAFVETLLIAQSHQSLDNSDVGGYGEASPTFSYAVAGFSTRIATVVAFLSYIITKVKD